MMARNEHFFNNTNDLLAKLSEQIAKNLQDAILKTNKASLLVSGGNTPKALFEKLSKIDLSWEKVTIGLCDERWVSITNKDSNELLVKTYLLKNSAKKANFIGMYKKDTQASEYEKLCSKKIKEELYPFNIIILGMGDDAHTASLFPNNNKLNEAFDLNNKNFCISINPDNAPHQRMSLTRAAILSSEHIYLHFEGENKTKVYNDVLNSKDMYKAPILSILNEKNKNIEVYYK